MSAMEEANWRKALQVRGRDWVAREPKTRLGLPNDSPLEVVFEEPLPSRAFCRSWGAEQENWPFVPSPGMIAGLVLTVIIVASTVMAIRAFETSPSPHSITGR